MVNSYTIITSLFFIYQEFSNVPLQITTQSQHTQVL